MVRDVKLSLVLDPVFWQDPPAIEIRFNNRELFTGSLVQSQTFDWLLEAQDHNRLSVFLLNKKDSDTQDGRDKAVIVNKIGVEGFYYETFMHQTRYRPDYSDGYYQYAKDHGITVEPVIHSNYLGFNGEWFLEFTWPTFSWIYQLETNGQGWIYEKNI